MADDTLRDAAQAVVDAWIDDESGMATFDPEVIDDLRRALDALEFADVAALAAAGPERCTECGEPIDAHADADDHVAVVITEIAAAETPGPERCAECGREIAPVGWYHTDDRAAYTLDHFATLTRPAALPSTDPHMDADRNEGAST